MLSCAPWRQNLLLADRYGSGRVFLAGDAVHLVIPTGGLGMNSGVGDAIDLSWKLAATLAGWGGPNLLGSYEVERRQIGERNVGASRYATLGRRKWRSHVAAEHPRQYAGGRSRPEPFSAAVADVEQRKSNEMIGAELGYRYVNSPVICNIPGGPEHLFREYHADHLAGRAPAACLARRRHGDAGPDTRRLHPPQAWPQHADPGGLEKAIRAHGAPVRVLDVPDRIAREIYGFDLILLRPDMHVVWRGKQAPDNAAEIAAVATGHASERG